MDTLIYREPFDVPGNYTFGAGVEVSAGAARLVSVPPYSTANDTIEPVAGVTADSLSSFVVQQNITGLDAIRHVVLLDGIAWWFNGSQWVLSASTYAQSNDPDTINANISQLDLSGGKAVRFRSFLHSDDGTTTPELLDVQVEYTPYVARPAAPNKVFVVGFVTRGGDPVEGALVTWSHPTFMHGDHEFLAHTFDPVVTDSEGRWRLAVTETGSIKAEPYTVTIDDGSGVVETYEGVCVPDETVPFLVDWADIRPITLTNDIAIPADLGGAVRKDFRLSRLEDFQRTVTFTDAADVPQDMSSLSAASMVFSKDIAGVSVVSTLSIGSGIDDSAKASGELTWTLDQSLVGDLTQGLWYRLTMTGYPNAGPKTTLYGFVYLEQ